LALGFGLEVFLQFGVDAILSFSPIHLRDYFSFKIKSQAAYISEVSGCITKQHATKPGEKGRRRVYNTKTHTQTQRSSSRVMSMTSSL
jgi:hypothetical protein